MNRLAVVLVAVVLVAVVLVAVVLGRSETRGTRVCVLTACELLEPHQAETRCHDMQDRYRLRLTRE
jgi:hypothetical protein